METSEAIITIARWEVRSVALPEVLDLLTQLRAASLAESGCLGYEVFSHVGDRASLLLVERYRDRVSLEMHRSAPHYEDLLRKRILPLLSSRHVELLRPW